MNGNLFDPENMTPEPPAVNVDSPVVRAALNFEQKEFRKRNAKRPRPQLTGDQSQEGLFQRFHAEHPEIYRELCRLARNLKSQGLEKYSIVGIYEVIRFNDAYSNTGEKPFKLNNNYRSRYARLIMENEPDLQGFFETRELRTL